jgi:putative tRNA adenosine deaminase-associated protein
MVADTRGFAVMAQRMDGSWQVSPLPVALLNSLDGLVAALRHQAPQTTPVAFADIDDEFFVALRLDSSGEPRALLSDVTAATEYDLADDVVDLLGEEPPDDGDEVWPAGDMTLFDDLGLPELELGAILDNLDLYADEMLLAIARRLGFADEFTTAMAMVQH